MRECRGYLQVSRTEVLHKTTHLVWPLRRDVDKPLNVKRARHETTELCPIIALCQRLISERHRSSFRAGPADFSDYLIGEIDRRAGCTMTLTFDRRLAATEGFEEPGIETGYPTRVSEP